MSHYQIGELQFSADDPVLADALAVVHGSKTRPLCLCLRPGVPMYVAKVRGRHCIKRMPDTGPDHHPSCDSYQPPPELSGLAQVMGTAVQECAENGLTALRLDFSLSKGAARSAPVAAGTLVDSVKTDGHKLSLRGVLHLLWEHAGFNRWTPAMHGKRSWAVVQRHVLEAAAGMTIKGAPLVDLLYVPEPFHVDVKDEIAARQKAMVYGMAGAPGGSRRLMVVVGLVREFGLSRYGYKVVLKHAPDLPFMLNEDIHRRIQKRFEVELGLWDAIEESQLLLVGTFGADRNGIAQLEEVALMPVTDQWIPFDTAFEYDVVTGLTLQKRRFSKGLRYNLAPNRPLACAVLHDTEPTATALYIVAPTDDEDHASTVQDLAQTSRLASWIWQAGADGMPAFPPAASCLWRSSDSGAS